MPSTALVRRRHVDLLRTASAQCLREVTTPRP
ncbi:putative leader peptide [Modestobacter muralis]